MISRYFNIFLHFQELQEHRLFWSFCLINQISNIGPKICLDIQLFLYKIGSTNMLIMNFQVQLGAIKELGKNVLLNMSAADR